MAYMLYIVLYLLWALFMTLTYNFNPQVLLLQSLQREVYVLAQLPQEVLPPQGVGRGKSAETG